MSSDAATNQRPFIFRAMGWLWTAVKYYLMLLGLLVVLTPFIFGSLMGRFGKDDARVKVPENKPSLLHIVLEGHISTEINEPSSDPISMLFDRRNYIRPRNLATVMEHAAQDSRIRGVLVEINFLSGNIVDVLELRRAFEPFKESEKPLHFHVNAVGNGEYLLSSIADNIAMTLAGSIAATGPVLTVPYFAATLEKLGIEFEVFQAGRYKNVFESFVENAPSQESLEMFNALESSIRSHMVSLIAGSRHVEYSLADAWLRQGFFSAQDALSAGMVDHVAYFNEYKDDFVRELGSENLLKLSDYQPYALQQQREKRGDVDQNIALAIIEASGEIHTYREASSGFDQEQVITPGRIIPQLRWAAEDDDIKAVVLRIDSPGGSAIAADMIWEEVRKLTEVKPVVVSMASVAASGGYYIAAPATTIVAEPLSITGSIGVISAIPVLSGFQEKYGVHFHTTSQSDRSRLFDPATSPSDFDRALLNTMVDDFYQTFVSKVASGRKITFEEADHMAQGKVFTGAQALQVGLIDDIGGLDSAFEIAKDLAGLDTSKRYLLKQYKAAPDNFFSCIRSGESIFRCLQFLDTRLPRLNWLSMLAPELASETLPLEVDKAYRWISLAKKERTISLMPLILLNE